MPPSCQDGDPAGWHHTIACFTPVSIPAILRARIAEGEWRNGPLPSVKQLQQEHDVGRDTVLHAIEILRTEGLVFTVPRRGTYVSPDAR
jgi:GntR family transcriptional regulator